MEETLRELKEALTTTDKASFFLVLLIVATLVSFQALLLGKRQICLTLQGEEAQASELTPCRAQLRYVSSALVIGSLGFFMMLAQRSWQEAAAGGDRVAFCSANRNLWASLFVFVAALIRLYDLRAVERQRQPTEGEMVENDALPA